MDLNQNTHGETKEPDIHSKRVQQAIFLLNLGEQGWRSGERSRLPPNECGPGSIPTRCHMSVDFVVGSFLAPGVLQWGLKIPVRAG